MLCSSILQSLSGMIMPRVVLSLVTYIMMINTFYINLIDHTSIFSNINARVLYVTMTVRYDHDKGCIIPGDLHNDNQYLLYYFINHTSIFFNINALLFDLTISVRYDNDKGCIIPGDPHNDDQYLLY